MTAATATKNKPVSTRNSVEQKGAETATAKSKNDILNAAARCFEQNGFAATSIDDVASALSATKGMIYHHFRSKTDLFFAVYRRGMEINFDAIRPHTQSPENALTRLTHMSLSHAVALMAYQPYQIVLAQGVTMHQSGSTTAAQRETLVELIDSRNSYEAQFRQAIIEAAEEEGFDLPSPSVASKCFLAALNGTVFWYKPRRKNPRGEQLGLARELVTFALRGLGAKIDTEAFKNWETTK